MQPSGYLLLALLRPVLCGSTAAAAAIQGYIIPAVSVALKFESRFTASLSLLPVIALELVFVLVLVVAAKIIRHLAHHQQQQCFLRAESALSSFS
jgi:hypothetical protein